MRFLTVPDSEGTVEWRKTRGERGEGPDKRRESAWSARRERERRMEKGKRERDRRVEQGKKERERRVGKYGKGEERK